MPHEKEPKSPSTQLSGNYQLPDEKEPKQWPDCLVHSFKTLKGYEHDDRNWNELFYGEVRKACGKLLKICDNDLRTADKCMVELSTWLEDVCEGKPWTIWAIVRHAPDWFIKHKGTANVARSRKRFLDAIAHGRATRENAPDRELTTAKQVLNQLRHLPAIPRARQDDDDF